MNINTTVTGKVITARIEGRLDAHTVSEYVRDVADVVSATHPYVALDMEAVEFMDSSALAALVKTLKRCMEHRGSVVLIAVSEPVRIILELTRLEEVFPRVGSLEDARSSFAGAR